MNTKETQSTKATKGFTLMELIIVLAILAIIGAILIPMFLNTTERARLRSDIQSARVIQNAMDLYHIERGERVAGGTDHAQVLGNLASAGYIELRNANVQTEGADWIIEMVGTNHHIRVDVSSSPESVRDLIPNLSEAERQMVHPAP